MDNLISGLSEVSVNDDDNITVYNFKQGELGNCGMISSMSTLAMNKDLYNKIVPRGQNFDSKNSSNVVFKLYKLGKRYKVMVDKTLKTSNNSLIYCKSSTDNLVGPLLEKALVELHFDGNYESAIGIPASFVMSCLTKNFFEELYFLANENFPDINELISYGLKTKSQMTVNFKDIQASQCNLKTCHSYSLLDREKSENNLVKLYNPHGKIVSISKKDFLKTIKVFEICYFGNKIFGIPEIKKKVNFVHKWATLKSNEMIHFVDCKLDVTEDETEILINVVLKKFSENIIPTIFVINTYENTIIKSSLSVGKVNSKLKYFHKSSLRKKLMRGKYKIVVVMSKWDTLESCEECRKYLENNGNEFLFRLAASEHCLVEKSSEKETDEVKGFLYDWRSRLQ